MIDKLELAKAPHEDERNGFTHAVMEELSGAPSNSRTNDEARIDPVDYRISRQHARNLCNGLNQLQNEMCMQAWKNDGYRTKSKYDTYETFGEMWAREEREMRAFERKHHYRPLDPRAPWNQDPSRLNADRTVRCLGPDAPKTKGDERFRCQPESNGGFW